MGVPLSSYDANRAPFLNPFKHSPDAVHSDRQDRNIWLGSPHQSSNPEKNEIGVVEIVKSDEDCAKLTGNLIMVSLDDRLKYGALSYAWGDQVESEHIVINGLERRH